ncbi:collagen binding domain-containing protein [Lactococcus insecticola]|uniref:Gram-positive cocci surface proteins LPxTG domain-containing protein n=1 Tax=Pseudolactococcus insecticola TaxID=2709158 RepID=A0A6A0B6F6_9LACT|nr:collagen binding domain-containing protein [Lactococcus insecticola]GFH41039.1 hypothetical protein Hs20B_14370 [Lactococcus insecticola]
MKQIQSNSAVLTYDSVGNAANPIKSANKKVSHFRAWKSGKIWLYAAGVMLVSAMTSVGLPDNISHTLPKMAQGSRVYADTIEKDTSFLSNLVITSENGYDPTYFNQYSNVELTADWVLGDYQKGDTVNFAFDTTYVSVANQISFNLYANQTDADGNEVLDADGNPVKISVGTVVVNTDGTGTVTFNDPTNYLSTHTNVHGTMSILTRMNSDVTPNQTITINTSWGDQSVTINDSNSEQISSDELIAKWNDNIDSDGALSWGIRVNYAGESLKNVVVNDTLESSAKIIPGSVVINEVTYTNYIADIGADVTDQFEIDYVDDQHFTVNFGNIDKTYLIHYKSTITDPNDKVIDNSVSLTDDNHPKNSADANYKVTTGQGDVVGDDKPVDVESESEYESDSDSESESESDNHSDSESESESYSHSESESESESDSHSESESESESDSHSDSESESESDSHSDSESESESDSHSDSESESESDSHSDSESDSLSDSHSDSESESESDSHSDSESDSESDSHSESESDSLSDSHSDSESESESDSHSDSESESESDSHSESESESESDSHSESESESESDSHSDSESESESDSHSESESESESDSHSDSERESESDSHSESESESESDSHSESERESESDSHSDSESDSLSDSHSDSESDSESDSHSDSENESESDSHSDSESESESDSHSESESESDSDSHFESDHETPVVPNTSHPDNGSLPKTGDSDELSKEISLVAGGMLAAGALMTAKKRRRNARTK